MSAGSRGIQLLIWIIVFTVLCTVCIGLRFWAAALSRRKLLPDDYMVLFALANTISLEGVVIWAIYNGLGKHTNELNPYEFGVQFKLILASGVTWLLGTVFIKLSVLWLYTRIFSTKTFKLWAHIMMGVVACYGVAFLILFMTQCRPISQQWDPVPGGTCRNIVVQELTSVSLNMVVDIGIVIMPLPVLWSLQLAVRSKLVVSVMFSIGFITIGIMAWRLQFTISTLNDTDFVFNLFDIGLISLLELWLGIIAACIPTLGPLLKTYVKPVITRLTELSDGNNIRLQSKTAGSGVDSRSTLYAKKQYSQIEEESSKSFHTNGAEIPTVTTNIMFEPGKKTVTETRGVIYVQHDIEAQ
ncbi:uncharacterized protein Triagg1_3475 [Trichoderma aggressivum f. europaeum]|uniref:Rhodopsin domain-containing protein n=1 Tax=Trichoderma aggressivum f. europaeum TaxID=173218 RepID=A0AAE1IIB7_9HYPO|nr:hypothetical protein Triagg1_3475 [Trichoderma aggressivum f. europaeum]